MKIYSGTVTGPLHDKKNIPNQGYGYRVKDNCSLIVVSDGAGSHDLSHIGSQLVVDKVIEFFTEYYNSKENINNFLNNTVNYARESLLNQEEYSRMGCTLSVGLLSESKWGVSVVGDSFAVVCSDGMHERYSNSGEFEFANITELLTSHDPNIITVTDNYPAEMISVGSDGLDSVSVSGQNIHSAFWDGLVRRSYDDSLNVQELLEFLKSRDKLFDDTTLVMSMLG